MMSKAQVGKWNYGAVDSTSSTYNENEFTLEGTYISAKGKNKKTFPETSTTFTSSNCYFNLHTSEVPTKFSQGYCFIYLIDIKYKK